ncbi:hypothetical protein [Thermococcus camini]|uniref:Uncharacterized protein n=1 Tax=Thermococcus camini TaxID=2016373 RepID=A0A7G2D8N3_9EURY|nr:hypothetical protein [Thermococcus camini]CAD5243535.1 conserved protein of unknown function [Thermococcus camini]
MEVWAEKVHVRNERLWKLGLSYLAISLVLLAASVGRWPVLPLMNVFIALAFLVLASRFRAVRVTCEGETLLLVPNYSTSPLVVRRPGGEVLFREFFPLLWENELETPCGTLRVKAIPHRFGKVELLIRAGENEVRLP